MSKVNCSYTEAIRALPSMCDETSRISIPGFLDMFQDIAGYHAKTIGIGALELEEKGLFWIVSKVRLKINSQHNFSFLCCAGVFVFDVRHYFFQLFVEHV